MVSVDTAAVGAVIGTAAGVSVSVIIVVSFALGVLASVLCYISRRSHKASSHSNPPTAYDEVMANDMVAKDVVEMNATTPQTISK